MNRRLFVLFACLFVVMIGFGITLPVLPFYVERLALDGGGSQRDVVLHVTLLAAVYPLMQLIFAPLWGRWSDRIGRRPVILLGISGYVIAQVLFGVSMSLWLLYVARIAGGILSSATLPASAAYVVDLTSREERTRGMAWLGTAASLGVVVGPALGGLFSRDRHFYWRIGHFEISSFSSPFFAAAFLGVLTLFAASRVLPESLHATTCGEGRRQENTNWIGLVTALLPLLALAIASQFVLAMFEGTFALFAQAKFNFGPVDVGYAFMVCGLVMTIFQVGAVGILAGRLGGMTQVAAGFALLGTGIILLAAAESRILVYAFIAILSLGMALVLPNVAAMISTRGGDQQAGSSLGVLNAANSLGQAGGPVFGGALFVWHANATYLFAGTASMAIALLAAWKSLRDRRTPLLERSPNK